MYCDSAAAAVLQQVAQKREIDEAAMHACASFSGFAALKVCRFDFQVITILQADNFVSCANSKIVGNCGLAIRRAVSSRPV
jgi:hypothetical protein